MTVNFWAKIDLLSDLVIEYVENKDAIGTIDHSYTLNNIIGLKIDNIHHQILECINKMNLNDKIWIKEDLKNHNFNSFVIQNNTVFNYMLNFFDIYDQEL